MPLPLEPSSLISTSPPPLPKGDHHPRCGVFKEEAYLMLLKYVHNIKIGFQTLSFCSSFFFFFFFYLLHLKKLW